jgi:hypothetical protein
MPQEMWPPSSAGPEGQEAELILRAFTRDFAVNGPSIVRIARTTLAGWQRYKHHPDGRVRDRITWEAHELATTYTAAVAAAVRYLHKQTQLVKRLRALLAQLKLDP